MAASVIYTTTPEGITFVTAKGTSGRTVTGSYRDDDPDWKKREVVNDTIKDAERYD